MNIKIKKLSTNAKMPFRANQTDAGADLYATSIEIKDDGRIVYGTGLAFEIPKGYVGLLTPRSSCSKMDVYIPNSVGVIDSDYRGEVMVVFKYNKQFKYSESSNFFMNREPSFESYKIGDRIAQILIVPIELAEFTEVNELSETGRGLGGFGSTGK